MINNNFNMTQEENIFCAKRIMVDSIYMAANLEGIAITFAQTSDILNNVNVNSLTPTNINKICCLRDGWEFLFNNINSELDLVFIESLHEIIARFDVPYQYLGKLRTEEVLISGTNWRPEIPNADDLFHMLADFKKIPDATERAFVTGLSVMRIQPFKDGNKRIGCFVINKILIENGKGIFNIPVEMDGAFKENLVNFYETNNISPFIEWCTNNFIQGTINKSPKNIKK